MMNNQQVIAQFFAESKLPFYFKEKERLTDELSDLKSEISRWESITKQMREITKNIEVIVPKHTAENVTVSKELNARRKEITHPYSKHAQMELELALGEKEHLLKQLKIRLDYAKNDVPIHSSIISFLKEENYAVSFFKQLSDQYGQYPVYTVLFKALELNKNKQLLEEVVRKLDRIDTIENTGLYFHSCIARALNACEKKKRK